MRDHVLLQAIARVNRPYADASGIRKRVGLVVDFVGVLRELRKALQFDSSDVSGVIEDLDLLMQDFHARIASAEANYLQDMGAGSADERLERIIYGRFLEPEARQAFFEAYKEIEALWEILSPAPELHGRIEAFKRLAQLYTAVRNAYADEVSYAADLARKTHGLVAESATQKGPGYRAKVATFDLRTLEALRSEPGADEAKVFNLVRGLRQEIASEPDRRPVLLPLKERADRILKDLAERTASGLEAMERLAVLAREKETAAAAAQDSGLSPHAFAVHWALKDDAGLGAAGIATLDLAQRAEALLDRFPNAAVNADEQRRLRAALYSPLLALDSDARKRMVERIVAILLGTDADANA
jgi:type I restriction enzyme R subunit